MQVGFRRCPGISLALSACAVSHLLYVFFKLKEIILGIYELVLGEDNQADQARAMQQQMPGGSSGPLMDEQKAFKAEWEALKITDYKNALQHIEKTILKQ